MDLQADQSETVADRVKDMGRVKIADVPTLDIGTLTLGEMAQLELESGRSMDSLLKGRATLLLVALWVADHRQSSGQPRSWQELGSLKVFGA